MKKNVRGDDVYYYVEWSRMFVYDRHSVTRLIPEMPGLVFMQHKVNRKMVNMLVLACWRDGCRVGIKKLMDEYTMTHVSIRERLSESEVYFRYAVIDTSQNDIKDIMYWLIKEYKPELNDIAGFTDSKRYINIYLKESFES
ncbi:MAG: hypothetical protein GXY14_10795 [Spirochaetes bacterium]|nr:hypothetical protein [Spirochaetota bacterium]